MDLRSALVCLPLAAFVLLVGVFCARCTGWRSAFAHAATVWGVLVVVLTEVLSAFHKLTVPGLSAGWLILDTIAVWYLYRRTGCWRSLQIRSRISTFVSRFGEQLREAEDLALISMVVVLLCLVGLTAAFCPPNSWDAMEYHMPRIVHWLQNQSVGFYATNETKQLYMAPWSEYAMLHLHALSGGDYLDNLVQWFSLAGCVLCSTLIAQILGAGYRGQVLAAVICATIPQGLLEASGAQNDVNVAFWLLILTYYVFSLDHGWTWWRTIAVGCSLGLACLTKGTAWVLAPPIMAAAMALWFWRERSRIDRYLLVVGITVLLLNSGHMLRNYQLYGAPLGPTALVPPKGFKVTNNKFTAGAAASNAIRNAALHLGTLSPAVNDRIEAAIAHLVKLTGEDLNDPDTTWDATVFHVPAMSRHEATAGNSVHFAAGMLTFAILVCIWRRQKLRMALALSIGLATASLLFCVAFKWQPWNTRFHFALFVIWCPVIGVVLERVLPRVATVILCTVLFLIAVPTALENQIRPIGSVDFLSDRNIFNQSRRALYFMDNHELLASYTAAADFAKSRGCSDIGLDLALHRYEYPLQVLLGVQNGQKGVRQVQVTDVSRIYSTSQSETEPCVVIAPGLATVKYKTDFYAAKGMLMRTFGNVLVMSSGAAAAK
jgi:hypothetical protein